MRRVRIVLVLATGWAAGCARPTPTPVPAPAPVAVDRPRFDNPEYANWKKFPVGTVVKRKSVSSSEAGTASTTSVETFTLKELTDTEATVERQNTTDRSDGSYHAVNPPELRKVPRQYTLPDGMTADDLTKPSPKAKRAADETLAVLGKEYKTTVYTWGDSTEGGAMNVKVWLSDEVPGRVVKQTMTVPKLKNTTVEDVIEVKLP